MRSDSASSLYVYMLASRTRVLYAGCIRDLHRRVYQHKTGAIAGFTSRYRVNRLVWFERHDSAAAGVTREREIKGWRRSRKVTLIESTNAGWLDLAVVWFDLPSGQVPRVRSG